MSEDQLFLTIFTPTYNRADRLFRAYNSLKTQTFTDFEWLIVDDGSTDNTEEVINDFITQSPDMNIRYYKIAHGGKHFATNKSYDEAQGFLYMRIDSDDELYNENTLQDIFDMWNSLSEDEQEEFQGIEGYYVDQNNNRLGDFFEKKTIIDIDFYKKIVFENTIKLNTPGATKTDSLKREYFPEVKDEYLSYFPEWIIWMRLLVKYSHKELLSPKILYRYHLDEADSVSTNSGKTKAHYFDCVYQLNEWLPNFYDSYPDYFKESALTLFNESQRWKYGVWETYKKLDNNTAKRLFLTARFRRIKKRIIRKMSILKGLIKFIKKTGAVF